MRTLRLPFRSLVRSPGVAAAVVVTLGLGIGACVAIFSAVDGVLLRPLPYAQPDRLVVVRESLMPRLPELAASPNHYFAWREQVASFQSLAAWHEGSHNLTGLGEPMRVSAGRVTANMFETLGVRPALGRSFSTAEDRAGSDKVVILGHAFWRRHFGAQPLVLHRSLTLDGQSHTIVGVMPAGFQLDRPLDVFTPAAYPRSDVHDIGVIGRLKTGATFEQARDELAVIARGLSNESAHVKRAWGVQLFPLLERRVGDVRAALLTLLGSVGLLLLIACVNAANLLLARATTRGRDIAVRTALGASRGRLVRELLGESLLLATAGSLLGVLLAKAGLRAFLVLAPDALPRASEVGIDGRALAFAALLALVTGAGFGMAPALWSTRLDVMDVLKRSGARGATETSGHQRLRSALVVAEIAIALVLLAGGGLLIRSFVELQSVSPGFQPQGALALTLSLPVNRYPVGGQQAAFAAQAVDHLAAVPGVDSVGAAQGMPLDSVANHVFYFSIAGRPDPTDRPTASAFSVTGDFFQAMGIPLLRGRRFDRRDGANSPRVTIINEALARRYFAGLDPIGQRVGAVPGEWFEIVGVVGDVRFDRLDGDPGMQAYAPFTQAPADWGALTFVVRAAPTAGLQARLRAAIHAVDPGQAITHLRPAREWIAASLARRRFTVTLFAGFAATALLLAAIGIYGVMAFAVSRRTREFGIRIALGARPRDVFVLVLSRAGWMVGLGVATGLIGAFVLTRLLSSLLFGVTPTDPLTLIGVAVLLALVAVGACLLPARRATRIDPMTALQAE